jgi:hypothetical protein
MEESVAEPITNQVALRDYIDTLFAERQRALGGALETRDTMIGDLRDFMLAQFEEKQKALDAALTAQKEAVVKAEVATDRIATRAQADQEALRGEMAERLSALRRELEAATAAQKRELESVTSAQKEAVVKQEAATEKRFESVNEWRAQSADRERSQQEDRALLAASFMPREVAESQMGTLRGQVTDLRSAADKGAGAHTGVSELQGKALLLVAAIAGLLGALLGTGHVFG